MKLKRLISTILCFALLFTCITIPVSAGTGDVNLSIGSTVFGSGGANNINWTGAQLNDMWGYRISIWYAEHDENTSNDNPEYNWNMAIQMGRTVDVRREPITLKTNNSVVTPNNWGYFGVFDYTTKMQTLSPWLRYGASNEGNNYYYYSYSSQDRTALKTEDGTYNNHVSNRDMVCTILGNNLQSSDDINSAANQVISFMEQNMDKLGNAEDAQSVYKLLKNNVAELTPSTIGLPLVTGTNKVNWSAEKFKAYFSHPAVVKLLIDACGAPMDYMDFYSGYNKNPNSGVETYGQYKIYIEPVMARNYGGVLKSFTLQDIRAFDMNQSNWSKRIANNLGESGFSQIANAFKLEKEDKSLKFFDEYGNQHGVKGDQVAAFGWQGVTGNEINTDEGIMKQYQYNMKIGNYLGCAVVSSPSVGVYAGNSDLALVNELCMSMFGDVDKTISLIQINANIKTFLDIVNNYDMMKKALVSVICDSLKGNDSDIGITGSGIVTLAYMLNSIEQDDLKDFICDLILYDTYSSNKKESIISKWSDLGPKISGIGDGVDISLGISGETYNIKGTIKVAGKYNIEGLFRDETVINQVRQKLITGIVNYYNTVSGKVGITLENIANKSDTFEQLINTSKDTEVALISGSNKDEKNLMYLVQMGFFGDLVREMLSTTNEKAVVQLKPISIWYDNKIMDNGAVKKWAMASHKSLVTEIKNSWASTDNSSSSVYRRYTDDFMLGDNKVYGMLDYDNVIKELSDDAKLKNLPVKVDIIDYDKTRTMGESGVLVSDKSSGNTSLNTTDDAKNVFTVHRPEDEAGFISMVLSSALFNGEMSGIKYSNYDWEKYIYDGVVNFNNILIDNFCKIDVGVIEKNKTTGEAKVIKSGDSGKMASRFGKINILDSLYYGSPYISYNGKTYKITAMSRIPYDSTGNQLYDIDEFYKKAAEEVSKLSTSDLNKEIEYDCNGIIVSAGDQRVKNACIYPSTAELDASSTIGVALVVEEVDPPKLVTVYLDNYGSHVDTTIETLPKGTTKKDIEDIPGYDIVAGFVSSEEPDDGLDSGTTWDEIADDCPPYDTQWLSGPGEIKIVPDIEQIIYILARGQRNTSSVVSGGFTLGQQSISKRFDTANVIRPNLRTWGNINTARHSELRGNWRSGYWWAYCNIYNTSNDTYNINFDVWTDADKKIWASNYSTIVENNSTGTKKLNKNGITSDKVNASMKFVLWRGYDKPVAASYADSGYNNEVWSAYGIGSGNRYVNSGTTSSYTKNFNVKYNVGSSSDQDVTFGCTFGKKHYGTVNGDSRSLGTSLGVNIFEGWKGAQTASGGGAASSSIGGVRMTNVSSSTVRQNTIKFYPYVNMKYQDLNGTTKDLNVLSKYSSVITPVSTVEIGYKAGSDDSIGIVSDMWSTHKRALDKWGKNSTLPGGATYRLVNNGSAAPAVGIKTYSWYVPGDAVNAVYEGSYGNTQADAEQNHNNAVNSLVGAINGTPIRQRLQLNCSGTAITPGRGGTASWLHNLPFLNDDKYWLGGGNIKMNAKDVSTSRQYYRVSSDTNGNVYLTHGSSTDYTFNKSQDVNYILNQLNAEWKDVESKTNLVSTYLKSIIRNEGDDSEYVAGGRWYNEAFPGLCVCVSTTTIGVELNPSLAGKPVAVNMRYIAGNSAEPSKADIYKAYNRTWYSAENTNLGVTYRGSGVGPGNVNLNFRTKNWYIPNATVYDND